jgi:membrane-bound lytic murein transglycosylase B
MGMIFTHSAANASAEGFPNWLAEFRIQAVQSGLDPNVVDKVLGGANYIPRVIALDQKQPEKKITFNQYYANVVNQQRINTARSFYYQHSDVLNRVAAEYGVKPWYILSFWAIESDFGRHMGNFSVVDSLATLAYEGRRRELFSQELMDAIKIVAGNMRSNEALTGSWAGAMGQCQFMPSSYLRHAADGDGDGVRDIWGSKADVFASIASYLKNTGWKADESWGRRVRLPTGFNKDLLGREKKKPLAEWAALGVQNYDGSILPNEQMNAGVIILSEDVNQAYLTYGNYDVIMGWNRSVYFATAIGLLSDKIAAGL